MTRQEHLDWAKKRAFEYTDQGDMAQAWASFVSDMQKHEGTANHSAIELGTMQMLGGLISTPEQLRHFIDGFN